MHSDVLAEFIIYPMITCVGTGLFTLIGVVITQRTALKKTLLEQKQVQKKDANDRKERQANLDERLDRLEKKVDVHNGYAIKFSEVQTDIAKLDAKLGTVISLYSGIGAVVAEKQQEKKEDK